MEAPHDGTATAVCLGLRSGSTPRKNCSSARVLPMPAAARCDSRERGTIVSITSCAVRQWRITAAAERTAPEQFYYWRVSRREQSLRPRHTTVA